MEATTISELNALLKNLGLDEEPMGLFYTDEEPKEGLTPKPMETPTRAREMENAINWQEVFGNFSCVIGVIWRARKKKTAAYFSAEHFGCPGASFWLGFHKPQTEMITAYVSAGIPGHMEGEFYCDSVDNMRRVFKEIDPRPAPGKFLVFKPLSQFAEGEEPEFVSFFARPESMAGLHQLAFFATNDPEVVVSPWGAGCTGLGTWPQRYKEQGKTRAVIGGWDPSARKFYKTDEVSFSITLELFSEMVGRWKESFLTTKTWETVQKKIARSRKAWGEDKTEE